MVYTRVMGYARPVESFNIGKKGEHDERVLFTDPLSTKKTALTIDTQSVCLYGEKEKLEINCLKKGGFKHNLKSL